MRPQILLIIIGVAIILFNKRGNCHDNYTGSNDSLKVITFNVYGAPNSNWPTRIQMILDELSVIQPDLIGLQEIVETPGYNGLDNHARELADSLYYRTGFHYDYLFVRTHFAWNQYDEGIAILTRHIIIDSKEHDLPMGVFGRKVLWARVLTPGGIINFYTTHLEHSNLENIRISQVTTIKSFIETISSDHVAAADILCGDFNAVPNSQPIQLLTNPVSPEVRYIDTWANTNPGQPGYTVPSNNPTSRIDYIFLWENDLCQVLSSKRVFKNPNASHIYPSDHIGVYSTFKTTFTGMKIDLLTPVAGDEVIGHTLISWSVASPSISRTFTIYISNDAGKTWWQEWSGQSTTNSYLWNTTMRPDGTRYLIRIIAVGENIFEMGQTTSTFTVNNPGNVAPEVELLSPRGGETISGTHTIRWFAGDADGDSLRQILEISVDDGATWQHLSSLRSPVTTFQWHTNTIANSPNYRLRLCCSDGVLESVSITGNFKVYNEHIPLPDAIVRHLAGNSDALVQVHLIDPTQVTGDRYRITFDDTLYANKVYHVQNLTNGVRCVENARELDGVTEGPLFDGLRLSIKDFANAEIKDDSSGWFIGSSNLEINIYVPTIYLDLDVITGYAYPADYKITIHDHVVDTSDSFLGVPEQPMMFTLWNLTAGRKSALIFNDLDNNYNISRFDEIYILEPDRTGNLQLTWSLFFGGTAAVTLPQAGDVFIFKTKKPLTSKDIFEFSTSSGVADDQPGFPSSFELKQNYPNPFNSATTIRYTLPKQSHVSIKIYSLLGQEIKTLANESKLAGYYTAHWDGRDNYGNHVASGIYLCQLRAENVMFTRKIAVLK